jgi:hypothetical protein
MVISFLLTGAIGLFFTLFILVLFAFKKGHKLDFTQKKMNYILLIPAFLFGFIGISLNINNYINTIPNNELIKCPSHIGYKANLMVLYVKNINQCESDS